ncbi:hypothetical protein DB281_05825 (plasmid) [Borreliella garinii]|nr:hypothetical protein DB281_05825 [Borreliella garinii]
MILNIVSNYKNIVIEKLSIKGIQKGMFGKSINDLVCNEFVIQYHMNQIRMVWVFFALIR